MRHGASPPPLSFVNSFARRSTFHLFVSLLLSRSYSRSRFCASLQSAFRSACPALVMLSLRLSVALCFNASVISRFFFARKKERERERERESARVFFSVSTSFSPLMRISCLTFVVHRFYHGFTCWDRLCFSSGTWLLDIDIFEKRLDIKNLL